MPPMLSDQTEVARKSLGDEVVVAVPVSNPDINKLAAATAGLTIFGSLLPNLLAGVAVFVAAPLGLFAVGKWRSRKSPARAQARWGPLMAVFHATEVTLHPIISDRKWGVFGITKPKRLGGALESHPIGAVSFRRTNVAVDTRLTIDGVDYNVHGWYERDLRVALSQLGVASDRIPAAQPEPRSRQS